MKTQYRVLISGAMFYLLDMWFLKSHQKVLLEKEAKGEKLGLWTA